MHNGPSPITAQRHGSSNPLATTGSTSGQTTKPSIVVGASSNAHPSVGGGRTTTVPASTSPSNVRAAAVGLGGAVHPSLEPGLDVLGLEMNAEGHVSGPGLQRVSRMDNIFVTTDKERRMQDLAPVDSDSDSDHGLGGRRSKHSTSQADRALPAARRRSQIGPNASASFGIGAGGANTSGMGGDRGMGGGHLAASLDSGEATPANAGVRIPEVMAQEGFTADEATRYVGKGMGVAFASEPQEVGRRVGDPNKGASADTLVAMQARNEQVLSRHHVKEMAAAVDAHQSKKNKK